MRHNICKTCEAKDGRAGLLIDGECLNCHYTRETENAVIHADLSRTDDEIKRTLSILDE